MKKPKTERRYVLTLNEDQARIVSRACEFYARMTIGQFKELAFEVLMDGISRPDFCARRDQMEYHLEEARRVAFPELVYRGQSYGVGHYEHSDRAWNVYQVLRHKIAWTNHPEGGMTVDFFAPMQLSGEPLPECEVKEVEVHAD